MSEEDAEQGLNGLVARAVQGDRYAIEDLLTQIRPMVVRYCRARLGRTGGGAYTEADDVAQEVCVAVLNALPRYEDQGRPFAAYVFGIASHKVTDAHRRAARDLSSPVDEVPDSVDTEQGPEASAMAAATSVQLQKLLNVLPESHRDVLILRVIVGMSAEETGQMLGMSPGAVRVTQHRALAKLRQRIRPGAEVGA
ncbi:MAG: sigma-70 family RNA polymerase sigma factor [Corynebacteriales bacterium]|jgi:RNA polymerase sigma-70 factor (ECF subfamily)|nr:sigma-70 family RNA polymerase sigma factor [Mycobacteriales bacterium]